MMHSRTGGNGGCRSSASLAPLPQILCVRFQVKFEASLYALAHLRIVPHNEHLVSKLKGCREEEILSIVAEEGYHMVCSHHVKLTVGSMLEYVFERCGDAARVDLRDQVCALSDRLNQEISARGRDSATNECLQAKVNQLIADRAAQKAEAAALAEQVHATQMSLQENSAGIEELRREIECQRAAHDEVLVALKEQFAAALSAQQFAQEAAMEEALDPLRKENSLLKERLSLTSVLVPSIQEEDVPASGLTGLAEKHIRIACPGISTNQIGTWDEPDGVAVEIYPFGDHYDPDPIFHMDFVYHDALFQLKNESCRMEDGVLVLVLQNVPQPKLTLSPVNRAHMMPIEEEAVDNVPANPPDVIAMTPSPSLGTLTTVSSEWIATSCIDDVSHTSVAQLTQHAPGSESWISIGDANCFTPKTLFKAADGSGHFLPACHLQVGSKVLGSNDGHVLEVTRVRAQKARELIELQAGALSLVVTYNHRMLAPRDGDVTAIVDVYAGYLKPGDDIMCRAGNEPCVRSLTDVIVWVGDDAQYEVFEITFCPDEAVAVIREPSECLLSKGFKKKPNRRPLARNAQQRSDALSVPDTAHGEYSD